MIGSFQGETGSEGGVLSSMFMDFRNVSLSLDGGFTERKIIRKL
jgi:hypothetical protein